MSHRSTLATLFAIPVMILIGCTSPRERMVDSGPDCEAEGTNTVLIDGTCYCLAGHVLAPSRDRCVPEEAAADAAVESEVDAGDPMPDAGLPDAGPPPKGTLRDVGTSHSTCAEGCSAIGFACTGTCEGTAGRASYGYYDWDYGWYRSVHSEDLASCDATWPPSHRHTDGETYELGAVYCCCDIPEVTRVGGISGETCDQTCADRDFEGCADFHEWPGEGTGGMLVTYERPETGSVTYVVMGCAATPPAEKRIAGATRYLRDWDCACY